MYLNFICQVNRLNSDWDANHTYIMSVVDFSFVASHPDEQEWGQALALASHHVQAESHPKALHAIASLRDNLSELTQKGLFDRQRGGVRLWLPDGPLGSHHVSMLAGESGLGEFGTLADRALESEHLFIQFCVNVGFSIHSDNPNLPMPVTFDMFCSGTRMFSPGLPDVGLVRRHAP